MITIKEGLDLPILGNPAQHIEVAKPVTQVALLGDDYIGMKPTMLVREGDQVKLGQLVFEDKKTHAVDITVTRDGVTALFDGKTIIKWSGKPEQLSLYTAAAEIDVPLFFQTFSEFHISDLELTRLDKSTE